MSSERFPITTWIAEATDTTADQWREVPSFASSSGVNYAYVRADDLAGDGECIIVVIDGYDIDLWREPRESEGFTHMKGFNVAHLYAQRSA